MSNILRKRTIKNELKQALKQDCQSKKSCRVFLGYKNDKSIFEKIQKKVPNFSFFELIYIKDQLVHRTQANDEKAYPMGNATDDQIEKFTEEVAEKYAEYLTKEHKNIVTIPLINLPKGVIDYLHEKEIPNAKFQRSDKVGHLNLVLDVKGPLLVASEHGEQGRINEFVEKIIGIGVNCDFFNIQGLFDGIIFDLENATLEHEEDFFNKVYLFSNETKNIIKHISVHAHFGQNEAKSFVDVLNELFAGGDNIDDILHSISWFCKSLGEGDRKTKYVCRYIAFEALAGLWVRSDQQNKSTQQLITYTVAALLSDNIGDLENKKKVLKDAIELRNEIFHGQNTKEDKKKFNRRLSQRYSRLGEIYRVLFLYTINKI